MDKLLFTNITIFTLDNEAPYYQWGFIKVRDGKIYRMGKMSELDVDDGQSSEPWKVFDLEGMLVMPGMVCSHSHFYGQFVRGMPLKDSLSNWQQILSRLWWKVDKALDSEQIYYSTLMGIIEGIKSGTTTFIDHHASPNACEGSLDIIEKAVLETGVRACLAYEVSDRDGKCASMQGIEENTRFILKMKDKGQGRVKAAFGLHASYTLSDETLEKCAIHAKELNAGFHVHMAEDMADVYDSYRRCDRHVVERLERFNILGPDTVAAHCVHAGPLQWEILRATGTKVAHNSQSNANNAVGVAPVWRMLSAGVKVALASDGFTYDMFRELSFAAAVQRLENKSPGAMNRDEMNRFAFYNNFDICNSYFGKGVGILKEGNHADFIAVDYNPPTPMNEENIFSHMLSGFSGNVDTVVVDGKVLMHRKKLQFIDEKEVFSKCREEAARLWRKVEGF